MTEGPVERPRLVWRMAHRAAGAYLVAGVVVVVSDLVLPGWLSWVVAFSVLILMIPFWVSHFRHQRQLCVICASMTALDGNAAAQRHRVQLWLMHHSVVLLPVGGLVFLGPSLADSLFGWEFLPPMVVRLLSEVTYLIIGGSMHVSITHRILEPWCPYCHDWDEGGDHEPAPQPTPPVGHNLA